MTLARRARILYVHHRRELGGAPMSLYYLLRHLDAERFEAHVFCPPGPVTDLFRQADATVHAGPVAAFTHIWASTYRGRRWLLFLNELAKLPGHVVALRRVLRQTDFDLVHLNDSPLVPAAILARLSGVPVVWHLRSSLPPDRQGARRTQLLRRAIRRLSVRTIAITDDVADSFDIGSTVVPNSVDLDRFRPGDIAEARAEIGIPGDRPVVSYFGFIYPSKGLRDFIDAAHLLRGRGIEATYLIVGGGVRGDEFFGTLAGRALQRLGLARDYLQEATSLVSRLGLRDVATFLPFTRDTVPLYQASDVVVAPSRGPELGRPVIEAAACGVAVVASGSIGGAGIVLPGVTGEIVPRRSPEVLAAALERLIRDPEHCRELGRNAREFAEQEFDRARNAGRVMAIYDDVLEGAR